MENVNKSFTPIKNWAEDDRPREKLLRHGAAKLSNSELLAILINNGSGGRSAVDLAKDLLKQGNNSLNELAKLDLKSFQKVKGIGAAKAITIASALELGRRRHADGFLKKDKFTSPTEAAQYLKTQFQDYAHEIFAVIYLNQGNKVIKIEIISEGGITATVVDSRIILRNALLEKATSLILCHNHPSGNLKPSKADIEITEKLRQAANLLDIKVFDHIIVSNEGFFSFAEEGIL